VSQHIPAGSNIYGPGGGSSAAKAKKGSEPKGKKKSIDWAEVNFMTCIIINGIM
jgi:hypothetical protein